MGADGANSAVCALLEHQGIGKVRSVHLEEKPENTRVYKILVIPLQDTEYTEADGSGMCTLSERSAAGRVIESLPTKEGGTLPNCTAVTLHCKGSMGSGCVAQVRLLEPSDVDLQATNWHLCYARLTMRK